MKGRSIGLLSLACLGCLPPGCATKGSHPAPEATPPLPAQCQAYPERQVGEALDGVERDFRGADEAFRRGLKAADAGQPEVARSHFEEALLLDPTYGLAYLSLAESLRTLERSPHARAEALVRAVRLLPDNPRAHAELGLALSDLGRSQPARVHLQCALERRADLSEARLRLAIEWLDAEDPEAAEAQLRAYLDHEPPSLRVLGLLARSLERQARYGDAAETVLEAAELTGDNPVLLRRAAALFRRAERPERAAAAETRADAVDPPERKRSMRPLPPARRR